MVIDAKVLYMNITYITVCSGRALIGHPLYKMF